MCKQFNYANTSVEAICYKVRALRDGTFPLMFRLTQNRKRKYLSLGLSVEERFWDFKKNQPKRNCPETPLALSTAVRTASHIARASCHSSINLGLSLFSRNEGLAAAVVGLPVHFGPSIKTAPNVSSLSCGISSATLCKYFIIATF